MEQIFNRFLLVCTVLFLLQFLFGIISFGDENEDPSEYLERQDDLFRYFIYGYVILNIIGLLHILYWIGYFIIKG